MVAPSITKRLVQADFLTASYRIVGQAQVGRMGFTSLLNDDGASQIEVLGVNLARVHQPKKLVDCYEVIYIVKREIQAVCLKHKDDIGPHTMGRSGYPVSAHPIWLTTPVYEIQGNIEWAGRLDFSALMAEGGRDFIPIHDVTLTHVLVPTTSFECAAAFFNRQYLSTMALIKERQKWE